MSRQVLIALILAFIGIIQAMAETRWVHGVGYVEPVSEIRRLAFKHPGIIGKFFVELGQKVEAGELLAQQQNAEEQANLLVAESQLQSAKAELEQILAGINPHEIKAKQRAQWQAVLETRLAKRKLQRLQDLRKKNFVSEDEFDIASTEADVKNAENARLIAEVERLKQFVRDVDEQVGQANVAIAEARLLEAQRRLVETELRAPISGTILEFIRRVGESAFTLGSPEPVIMMADLSRLRVRAEIDENYALLLKSGQNAVIYGRSLGQREIPGKVTFVKQMMGDKTVFTQNSAERKDIDVLEIFIEPDQAVDFPVGLEVNVRVQVIDERVSGAGR